MKRLELLLMALLIAAFLAPLALTLAARRSWFAHPWLLGRSLAGMQTPRAPLEWTWDGLRSTRLQRALAARFDAGFAGREALIRLSSEVCFRLFRTCATSSNIVLGPGDQLFERPYLDEYFLRRPTRESLLELVEDLARLQAICDGRRLPFALLITPSKVAVDPGSAPPEWAARMDARPRGYDLLLPLLKAKGIRFVDGHALTLESGPPVPKFPKGAIHWGEAAAARSAQALVSLFRERGLACPPFDVESVEVSDEPRGAEADLVALMNLWHPWRYPVARPRVRHVDVPRGQRKSVAAVGGSFLHQIAHLLSLTGGFSEIDTHFYYKLRKFTDVDGNVVELMNRSSAFDFDRDIFAADALVVELNEEALLQAPAVRTFLKDALRHHAAPGITARPFRYETFVP